MEFIGKKISIVRKDDELSIVISASEKKNASVPMLLWLLLWTVSGPLLCYQLWNNPDKNTKVFIFIFGAFWLYYWVRAYYAFMWKRFGREVIKLREGKFFIKKDIRKKGKIHSYDMDFIKDLRKREAAGSSIMAALSSADWLSLKETLAFEYSGKEVRFGYDLSEQDAQELLRLLRHHIKAKAKERS